MAEALYLASITNSSMMLPSIPGRSFRHEQSDRFTSVVDDSAYAETDSKSFWDLKGMLTAANVVTELPQSCGRRIHAVYVVSRRRYASKRLLNTLSPRAQKVACLISRKHSNNRNTFPSTKACAKDALRCAKIHYRALPLSDVPDDGFVKEIRVLADKTPPVCEDEKEVSSNMRKGLKKRRRWCVLIDGHSYNRRGIKAHEYLYSFLHHISASEHIVHLASERRPNKMAVLHLRYDERECFGTLGATRGIREKRVCIRTSIDGGHRDVVYWAHANELVSAVHRAMQSQHVNSLYIASSPYVPAATLQNLRASFSKRVSLEETVSGVDHITMNFVERELAIRAKVFVGDLASTWSGTVYYKRRTLRKETFWSCVLLGKQRKLGYYARTGALKRPESTLFQLKF